jgi:molybdopterin molybdotransferase
MTMVFQDAFPAVGRPPLIPVAEARLLILSELAPLAPQRVGVSDVLGHVLAQTVRATEAVPRFTNSAMDGYALKAADTACAPARLRVIGTVAAGDEPEAVVSRGHAMRIMTGAPLPPGADAVCKIECVQVQDGGSAVIIEETVSPGTNVRHAGEDIAAGTEVFTPGTLLGPAHVGVLASMGMETLLVHPRPTVGVLSTGDELAPAGDALAPGKIRDANRPALLAQLGSDRFQGIDLGMAGDDELVLSDLLEASASQCDAIIASGGVSAGDHDVLKVALAKLGGATMRSLRVAVKPGQHIAIALLGDQRVPALERKSRVAPTGTISSTSCRGGCQWRSRPARLARTCSRSSRRSTTTVLRSRSPRAAVMPCCYPARITRPWKRPHTCCASQPMPGA